MAVAVLAAGTYAICLINNFHTDDWVVLNLLRDGFSLSDFFSMENAGRFRPVTNVLLYLRYLLFHDNPAPYYGLNIVLHAAVSVMLFRLLGKIGVSQRVALLAAIIFAVYYQHYEAVIWLYGIIREFAALAYIISLWYLYDYLTQDRRKSLWVFALFSTLGIFIVEDFVVAPLVFVLFTIIYTKSGSRLGKLRPVALAGFMGLAAYFILRTEVIVRPGIVEQYYYLGWHIAAKLFEYAGWFVIPSPAHPYFSSMSAKLPSALYLFWRGLSYLAIFGFIPFSIWLYMKSTRPVKFFILFVFVTLIPILPLNYKVGPRNIYLPSLGLAVMYAFAIDWLLASDKISSGIRKLAAIALLIYFGAGIAAVDITSLQYYRTQKQVSGIIDDLKSSDEDLNQYTYVLFDHVPGRAIIGPAMIYSFHFKHNVIASNDPVSGPVDIHAAADSLYNERIPLVIFDYRGGHMVNVTREYLPAKTSNH